MEIFEELGVKVVAISADTLESHRLYQEREGPFPFPLASDSDLVVIKAYGVLNDEGKRGERAIFILDVGGLVLYKNTRYSPSNLQHYQAIFEAVGALG